MVLAMPGSGAYLLTYQLSVNTIQERRRDTLRDGESNEESKGEEEEEEEEAGRRLSHCAIFYRHTLT